MYKVLSGDPNPKKIVHVCDPGGKLLASIPHKGLEIESEELASQLTKLGYSVTEIKAVAEDETPAPDTKTSGKGKGK